MKNASASNKEKQTQLSKEDSGNSSGKDTQDFEIENDEQPLQIDTSSNDTKLEQLDTEKQDIDKENIQVDVNKRNSDSSENVSAVIQVNSFCCHSETKFFNKKCRHIHFLGS